MIHFGKIKLYNRFPDPTEETKISNFKDVLKKYLLSKALQSVCNLSIV